jgi:hypothetical protein
MNIPFVQFNFVSQKMSTIKRKRMPVKPVEEETVGTVEEEAVGTFDITSNIGMWKTFVCQDYEPFQPICELFDNALAAIISAFTTIICGSIYLAIDFESGRGSIEHNGGLTFPTDMAGLAECFMYGAKKHSSSLNEHGCGLKTSLAILDPANSSWKLTIKKLNDVNELEYYTVQAPYQNKMQLRRTKIWPGTNTEKKNGSIIEFPITKDMFKPLYASKTPKMKDIPDLHDRIKCHLAYRWMRVPELLENRIRMYYNNDIVTPFKFNHDDVDEYVESRNRFPTIEMNDGTYKLDIETIKLKNTANKIPGSREFKYGQDYNGAHLYKNGRLIEAVNSNAGSGHRKLYSRIFGCVPDPHHNGYIVIVNISGKQGNLPPTVTTKTQFMASDLFNELIDELQDKLKNLFPKRDRISEAIDKKEWMADRINHLNTFPSISYTLDEEVSFTLPGGQRSPPIDMVETSGDSITIYECKAKVKPATEHIAQIFFNWVITKFAQPDKTIRPVLMLHPTEEANYTIPANILSYLSNLKTSYGFDLIIRNTKNKTLYPTSRI